MSERAERLGPWQHWAREALAHPRCTDSAARAALTQTAATGYEPCWRLKAHVAGLHVPAGEGEELGDG